ncbi:MAG: FecR family protein [Chlorobi bacterium]|nr:FecR family protein [Chlorobiota bacterium]
MGNKFDSKTLLAFSEGRYSYNDYLKVKQWFNHIDDFKHVKEELFQQWQELNMKGNVETGSLNHIFEKIQYNILLEEKRKAKRVFLWDYYRQVAAILLIPVLAFSLWYYLSAPPVQTANESWVEINSPEGARIQFMLPDSSMGWLNSGARLKYPAIFSKERKVELSGEAFFNVKHLARSTFTVSVADMDIKVLGTKFNVSAYSDDDFSEVVLKEGKVEINGKTGQFHYVLSPNDKITFNHKLKKLSHEKVNADSYVAWKDGFLVLDNEPLRQVVGRMERWYNVNIIIRDETLKNYRFKATFKDEPLEEVLRLMALTTPISYQIEKRNIDSKGVFKKKKVTLKLK